jgi:hypothetical protein
VSTVRALIVKPDGSARVEDVNPGRIAEDHLGGGWLECVTLDDAGLHAYVDEEGKFKGLAENVLATRLVEQYIHGFAKTDYIAGNAVFLGSTHGGREDNVPTDLLAVLSLVTGR